MVHELDRPEVVVDVPVDSFGKVLPRSLRRHEPVVQRLMAEDPGPRWCVHDDAAYAMLRRGHDPRWDIGGGDPGYVTAHIGQSAMTTVTG